MRQKVTELQAVVDDIKFQSFTNIDNWVAHINDRVEHVMRTCLTDAMHVWRKEVSGGNLTEDNKSYDAYHLKLETVSLDLKLKGNVLSVEPQVQTV